MKKLKTPLPDTYECIGCGSTYNLEVHHVFCASNRNNSNLYKCTEYLCYDHHRGNNGVHSGNKQLDTTLKQKHQERLEKGMTRQEFIKIFGRNYL